MATPDGCRLNAPNKIRKRFAQTVIRMHLSRLFGIPKWFASLEVAYYPVSEHTHPWRLSALRSYARAVKRTTSIDESAAKLFTGATTIPFLSATTQRGTDELIPANTAQKRSTSLHESRWTSQTASSSSSFTATAPTTVLYASNSLNRLTHVFSMCLLPSHS